ncbi:MAG: [FeFe] hydrogenase, group A [Clostridia bacterium]
MSKHLSQEIRVPIEKDNPSIMRNEDKCIKCGECKKICTEYIGVGGSFSLKNTSDVAVCINCGQCANVCPADSITEVYEYKDVQKEINDKDKIVIFSTSPSVRVALGEEFNADFGSFVEGKMVSLLKELGADYVLDTNFAADLTILEEASELIERITKNTAPLPQYTSCCPSWVKYAETYFPEILDNISSSKSPIGMQGPTIKTYFAKKMGIDPRKIVNVAVTPCTAKKMEIRRFEMNAASKYLNIDGISDMDYVITTRELAIWCKDRNIDFNSLSDAKFDSVMGTASGAGVIFGNTGGVMEAALRTAYEYITKEKSPDVLFELTPVRGMKEIKEATLNIAGTDINIAVVYGTENAKKMIEIVKSSEKQYHFIEVMTCPGGCIGGGGQPKHKDQDINEIRKKRVASLYKKDADMVLRKSHENEEIITLYKEFYGKPLSPLAEKMLHTKYFNKNKDLGGKELKKYVCTICGFIYDEEKGIPSANIAPKTTWDQLPDDWRCPLCGAAKSDFKELVETTKPQVKTSNSKANDLREMTVDELSAVCSNLARGCEKQYLAKESELFTKLSDYYKEQIPNKEQNTFKDLVGKINKDLEENFVNANEVADANKDRGSKRVLVWTEKVTRMVASILARYEKEGDSILENTKIYVCDICGFIYLGDTPPDICPVCKVPKMKILEVERR